MQYWINKNASTDNVVVLFETGVLVASCDEKACEDVGKQLAADTSPLQIFSKDDVEDIKFTQVRRIISRSTDSEVEILYVAKKDTETEFLNFADEEAKQGFLSALEDVLPANLTKTQYQQSIIGAIFPSLVSTAAALATSYFYINKLRWVTLIVGGLWLAVSLYMLVTRYREPPVITRWAPAGQYAKKAMGGLKAAFSYGVVAAIVIGFSSQLPLTHGKAALYDQIQRDALTAEEVPQLIDQGADPNYRPPGGDSPLRTALYYDETGIVEALLAGGADPGLEDNDGDTALGVALLYSDTPTLKAVLDGVSSLDNYPQLRKVVASASPSPQRMDLLGERGFDLMGVNENGKNLLQLALEEHAEYDFISYLLDKDIDAGFTIDGLSPSAFAREDGRQDVAKLLTAGGPAVSFKRLAAINQRLDELVISLVTQQNKALMDNMDPELKRVMKVLSAGEELEDIEPEEFYDEVFENAMVVKGNSIAHAILSEQCGALNFGNADALNAAIQTRLDERDEFLQVAELLVERDQMIWFKDERRLPSELLKDYQKRAQRLEMNFQSTDPADEEDLLDSCQQRLDRLTKV